MAIVLVVASLAIALGATAATMRHGRLSEQSVRLIVALISLLLITGLKFYAQVGSEVVTFVFGAIIGYIFSGHPINPVSQKRDGQ